MTFLNKITPRKIYMNLQAVSDRKEVAAEKLVEVDREQFRAEVKKLLLLTIAHPELRQEFAVLVAKVLGVSLSGEYFRICANCKQFVIESKNGNPEEWLSFDQVLGKAGVIGSHGVCPCCLEKEYSEFSDPEDEKGQS